MPRGLGRRGPQGVCSGESEEHLLAAAHGNALPYRGEAKVSDDELVLAGRQKDDTVARVLQTKQLLVAHVDVGRLSTGVLAGWPVNVDRGDVGRWRRPRRTLRPMRRAAEQAGTQDESRYPHDGIIIK